MSKGTRAGALLVAALTGLAGKAATGVPEETDRDTCLRTLPGHAATRYRDFGTDFDTNARQITAILRGPHRSRTGPYAAATDDAAHPDHSITRKGEPT